MRPRQPALGRAGEGQKQRRRAAERRQLARQLRGQQPGQHAEGGCEQKVDRRPAACAIDRPHHHVREPLEIDPADARAGEGEGVEAEHLVVTPHPLAGRHVPEGVAVPQKLGRERGRDEAAEGEGQHHQLRPIRQGQGLPGAGVQGADAGRNLIRAGGVDQGRHSGLLSGATDAIPRGSSGSQLMED